MTTLDYLTDTQMSQSEAKVLDIQETEKGTAIILDRTIFYPQGGGQPADQGTIGTFIVSDVRMDENGTVHHFGTGTLTKDETVKLEIDLDRRKLNSRLHSAGHLLDIALGELGLSLKPLKGCHFPDGPPFIQYEGTVEDPQELLSKLEAKANELVSKNLEVHTKNLSPEEAQAKGIYAPAGKSARVISFEGYEEFGCGGTHVTSSGEIGEIRIVKISSKKGNTTIRYEVG